jgi:hypothetical protein
MLHAGRMMRFDHNLYGPIQEKDFRAGERTWAQWRELGMDANSIFAVDDVLFVDADSDDFHLRSAAAAKKIGFVPFDPADAGVRVAAVK